MILHVPGEPSGARPRTGTSFRERVALHAAAHAEEIVPVQALDLAFTLRPGHWVDLDTLTETALAGLRDAGVLPRGLRGLDAVLATKRFGEDRGLRLARLPTKAVLGAAPLGPVALEVAGPALGSSPDREAKRAWRDLVAAAWGNRRPPAADVWVEVARSDARSITGGLEALLDVLEPVLGRDPRGRPWQEFFPNDDRIVWLRTVRGPGDAPLRLRLGVCG